jgi:hypothetical protein
LQRAERRSRAALQNEEARGLALEAAPHLTLVVDAE